MNYSRVRSGTTTNNVGVALSVDYLPKPMAGYFGSHLRTAIVYALDADSDGTYSTAIGDIRIDLEEQTGILSGRTRYEVRDADIIEVGGSNLRSLIPNWGSTLVKETASYAASNINPIFGILLSAYFDHVGGAKFEGVKGDTTLSIRDSRKWSFEKWRTNPGSFTFDLEIALLLISRLGDSSTKRIVSYELSVEAVTADQIPRPGIGAAINPTGNITDRTSFDIDWQ